MKEPKIRFKGFQGEWVEKALKEVAPLQRGFDLPSHSICTGLIPIAYSNGVLNYHNIGKCYAPGLVTGRSGTIGKFTFIESGMYWPHNTSLWVTNFFNNVPKYIYYMYHTIGIEKYSTGSGVPTLNRNDVHDIIIYCPSIAEQQSIADYFTNLDTLIQSTTKKIESLKQVKAASLQSMFPQEGETTPRVRFKGFEGEWEETPFSETFDYLKNNSLSRAELSDGGVVMNIHYGDVLIKYGECVDVGKEVKTFVKEEQVAKRLHQSCAITNGDIIFADAAEDNTVGKCSEIIAKEDDAIISGLHTIPCRPMKQFATRYLGYYLNSNAYHNQLLPHIQGTKISSISKKAISQTHINSPLDIAEQRAIASYFTNIDRQITLQTQRLEKLKQIKSACLDKMFV